MDVKEHYYYLDVLPHSAFSNFSLREKVSHSRGRSLPMKKKGARLPCQRAGQEEPRALAYHSSERARRTARNYRLPDQRAGPKNRGRSLAQQRGGQTNRRHISKNHETFFSFLDRSRIGEKRRENQFMYWISKNKEFDASPNENQRFKRKLMKMKVT